MGKLYSILCDLIENFVVCLICCPVYTCYGICEVGSCVKQECKDLSDNIEQTIADSECSCCYFGEPGDLNSRIQKVYLPEKTNIDSIRDEFRDITR